MSILAENNAADVPGGGYTPAIARLRTQLYRTIRDFFSRQNVLEVETPVLGGGGSTDPHIDLFQSWFEPCGGGDGSVQYLQSSPELHMKRLLARGFGDIFQIARVFRNAECGRVHNPEFTLLEWYRIGFCMEELIDEVVALLARLLGSRRVVRLAYREAVRGVTGLDPLAVSLEEVVAWCRTHGTAVPDLASLTDALQYLLAVHVEPSFDPAAFTVLHGFPARQAVLAQLDPADERIARRFELYCGGYELANGWEELVDALENRRRMCEDNETRRRLGKEPIPPDERFLHALTTRFPPCSGVALGFDRVVMLATGHEEIGSVLAFPWPAN